MEAQPRQLRHGATDRLKQPGQPGATLARHRRLVGKVKSIRRGVLRDKDHLVYAAGNQLADLLDDLLRRLAALRPFEAWDRAKGTAHVAPLGDLDVCRWAGRSTLKGGILGRRGTMPAGAQATLDGLYQAVDLIPAPGADDAVELRNLAVERLAKPLGEAAGRDHPLSRSAPVQIIEEAVDRFLLRRPDEGAGVDDDHIGQRRRLHREIAGAPQALGHAFSLDGVLGAPEVFDIERARAVGHRTKLTG